MVDVEGTQEGGIKGVGRWNEIGWQRTTETFIEREGIAPKGDG